LFVYHARADDSAATTRPNVVMFVVDDLCDWISPMGDQQAITPNMDRLAKRGVTFLNAHAPATYCAPSRTAIFTGQHASTTGFYRDQVYHFSRPDLKPMQVAFHEAGYATFGAGKLFHHRPGYVDLRGWDKFFVRSQWHRENGWDMIAWRHGESPFPQPHPSSPFNEGKKVTGGLFLEWGRVPNDREEAMADTIRTNWACEVLKKNHDKPFFLGVGLYTPHFPNYAPAKYFDLYNTDKIAIPAYKADDLDDLPDPIRKQKINRSRIHKELQERGLVKEAIHGYLASVSYADAMLGRVLDALDQSAHAENTIVILWSDHGYHHGEKGDWGKHTLWERTTNVPLLISGPGLAERAKVDASVSLIDLYPTLIDLCRLETLDHLEGVSIAQTLRNPQAAEDRKIYIPWMMPGAYAIVDRDWRYIRYRNGKEELYDLNKDPNEWHNLADQPEYAEIKRRYRAHAPDRFAEPEPAFKELRLIVEGESFHWIKK
ncbi:MAG: sulfatase, partial [Phycisphaeraceae bacterium]